MVAGLELLGGRQSSRLDDVIWHIARHQLHQRVELMRKWKFDTEMDEGRLERKLGTSLPMKAPQTSIQ